MGDTSRNYILARRGAGISDLTTADLATGNLDLEQAHQSGVYHVNATHQIGIATSTEVGLTADRYPIRVILTAAGGHVNFPADDAVAAISYWKVVNAAELPVSFSRKPFSSDRVIKNLYKAVPDLDDKLWVACKTVRANPIAAADPEALALVMDSLYNTALVMAPTAEQWAEIISSVDKTISSCVAAHRFPKFKISETAWMVAEPQGRKYGAIGTASDSKVALLETALCIKVNNDRMKARYDTLSSGVVTLASFAVANMFRFGLYETYEHQEYYTIFVSQHPTNPMQYIVNDMRTPAGAPACVGLAVNTVIDIGGVKLNKQMIELGNAMVLGSGLMHYLFNHTTGGNVLQGTLLTTMSMYQLIQSSTDMNEQVLITSLMYEALHPSNKRGIANLFFKNSGVTTHGRSAICPMYEQFSLDSFIQIRCNPYPAGSHKAFIALQAYKRVLQAGLGQFLPWADQSTMMIASCKEVLNNGARAHIGSNYYTGEPCTAQPATLDKFLPDLAAFVKTFHKGDSLSLSPHMSDVYAKAASSNWQSLLKSLKSADVSATNVDVVRKFLATSGSVHFTFDPNSEATWGKAIQDQKLALETINDVFN